MYQVFNHLMEAFVVGTDRNTVHYQEVPKPAFKKFLKRRRDFRLTDAVEGVFTLRFVYGTEWSKPGHDKLDAYGPGKDDTFILRVLPRSRNNRQENHLPPEEHPPHD